MQTGKYGIIDKDFAAAFTPAFFSSVAQRHYGGLILKYQFSNPETGSTQALFLAGPLLRGCMRAFA